MTDSAEKGLARWDSTWLLAKAARRHFALFQAKQREAEELRTATLQPEGDPLVLAHKADLCDDEAIEDGLAVVLFAAIAIEAHIDEYGSRRLVGKYFDRIDKLGTVSKWVVVPKLVTGREMPTDGQVFQLLKKLFWWRNKIARPKAKDVNLRNFVADVEARLSKSSEFIAFVPQAIQAMDELAMAARTLDPDDPLFGTELSGLASG